MALKIAVVTGANRGLGFGLVSNLASKLDGLGKWECNYDIVFACVRNMSKCEDLESLKKESKSDIRIVQMDVSKQDSVKRGCDEIKAQVSHIDMLINNAGILPQLLSENRGTIDDYTKSESDIINYDHFAEAYKVNAIAPVYVIRQLVPLIRAGQGKRIVNVTSVWGVISSPWSQSAVGALDYKMSKAALNMATMSIALDLKKDNIMVIAYNPGWVVSSRDVKEKTEPASGMSIYLGARKLLQVADYVNVEEHSGRWINHRFLDQDDPEYKKLLEF
mmetsp:Transcript_20763/g.35747  ORF Transcript_20763/g.35747 Transcript_20763/m.35747 type:complete len:276 (-) Transcript_20763:241-1068(-)